MMVEIFLAAFQDPEPMLHSSTGGRAKSTCPLPKPARVSLQHVGQTQCFQPSTAAWFHAPSSSQSFHPQRLQQQINDFVYWAHGFVYAQGESTHLTLSPGHYQWHSHQ